jgi:hypothetical protein
VVQEDTREVGPVALVDLKEGLVQTLHQPRDYISSGRISRPLYPQLQTRQDKHWGSLWESQGRKEDSRVRDKWCHRIHSGSTRETTRH